MSVLTLADKAELEREAANALLNSLLREPGSKKTLAQELGYTPEYLSQVRAIDRADHPRASSRPFSVRFLCRLAELPWPPDMRRQLVTHIQRSLTLGEEVRRVAYDLNDAAIEDAVWQIRRDHDDAQLRATPTEARRLNQLVTKGGPALLHRLSPDLWTMQYLELCFCLNDNLSGLGEHSQALYYALAAREILSEIDARLYPGDRERLEFMTINVLRAEAIAYKNLGLFRKAHVLFRRAEDLRPQYAHATFWESHLCSELLTTLGKQPRFSIYEAEALAERGLLAAESRAAVRTRFMLRLHLADCYVRRGNRKNLKKAQRIFESLAADVHAAEGLGTVHEVRIYRKYAFLAAQLGDDEAWRRWKMRGLELAETAGLEGQQRKIVADSHDRLRSLGVEIQVNCVSGASMTFDQIMGD